MLSVLIPVFAVHLVAAMSPGPAVLMTARVAMLRGMASATALSFGLAFGACFWAAAAMLGLAALFEVAPKLLIALKIVGATYLIWCAYKMWRGAREPLDVGTIKAPKISPLRAIVLGITTQLANPKPAVFFGAVFVSVVPHDADVTTFAAILMIVFFNEAIWNIFVARLFSLERTRAGYMRLKTPIDRVLGGLLAALGLKIATT